MAEIHLESFRRPLAPEPVLVLEDGATPTPIEVEDVDRMIVDVAGGSIVLEVVGEEVRIFGYDDRLERRPLYLELKVGVTIVTLPE